MMYFEHIYYLYFLVVIPVLILLFILYRSKQAKITAILGDDKLINKLTEKPALNIFFFKFSLLLSAVIFLILALADPYLPFAMQYGTTLPQTDIVFAVDVSKSMLAADAIPSRLAQAQNVILSTLNQLHGEQVAVVVFSGKADIYVPLTSDYDFVKNAVKNVSNSLVTKQGTSLKDALRLSSIVLNNKSNDVRLIVLLSDGETRESDFGQESDSVRKEGVNLFAFGFGTLNGSEIIEQNSKNNETGPLKKNGSIVVSHLNPESLLRIVNNQSGRYYQLGDIGQASDKLIEELQHIQQGKKAMVYAHKHYFQLFLLIALILLMLEILL